MHPADRRQALHRRRRRQDHPAAGAAGGRLRRGRAAAVRPRPRPHRRHAGQAGVDPRLAGGSCRNERVRCASCRSVGAVICAAGERLAPADRKLYALRDVTGTVESIPLIASSIMSKKIAEGAARAGARRQGRLRRVHEERRPRRGELAAHDGRTRRRARGAGRSPCSPTCPRRWAAPPATPSRSPSRSRCWPAAGRADVVELTLALAREMLAAAGLEAVDPADALADGRAMDVWRRMIAAQGGDPDAPLPTPRETHMVTAPASGMRQPAGRLAVGIAAWRLGAGRARKEDPVSAGAGVDAARPAGDGREGQPLLELHADEPGPLRARAGGPGRRRRDRRRSRAEPAGARPHRSHRIG